MLNAQRLTPAAEIQGTLSECCRLKMPEVKMQKAERLTTLTSVRLRQSLTPAAEIPGTLSECCRLKMPEILCM